MKNLSSRIGCFLRLTADYDGDGKAVIAVFRPSNGVRYLQQTSNGLTGVAFGASADKPISSAFVARVTICSYLEE